MIVISTYTKMYRKGLKFVDALLRDDVPAQNTPAQNTQAQAQSPQMPGTLQEQIDQVEPESSLTFIGWRAWRIKGDKLYSITRDVSWSTTEALVVEKETDNSNIAGLLMSTVQIVIVTGMYFAVVNPLLDTVSEVLLASGPDGVHSPVQNIIKLMVSFHKFFFPVAIIGMFGPPIFRHIITILNRNRTSPVHPGSHTPGIYAFNEAHQVNSIARSEQDSKSIIVRGTVELWGDTIEHERGVKGEFAFPLKLHDVLCASCSEWMPLSEYKDESKPPLHNGCDSSYGTGWRVPGVARLRAEIPKWFIEEEKIDG